MEIWMYRDRTLGVRLGGDGMARVSLWSPEARSVSLIHLGEEISLEKDDSGTWQGSRSMTEGDHYRFKMDEQIIPDPASLSQPLDVHGPSAVAHPENFEWTDDQWKNHRLSDYIFYEIHTGTFTEQGSFEGIISRLPYLKDLGVTALEIMPVAQFPGTRNWGYDGVFPYAVQHSYGGYRGLQRLVNAAHQHGLAVVLDVVYNHLGPEGNYLHGTAPYFTDKYKTPWGAALNFDNVFSEGVRNYFIGNALMWFRDFHIDALRLDAVHAINDAGPLHLLAELRHHTDELMRRTGKQYYLIVESDLNDTVFINSQNEKGYGMDAQWVDEFHHALRIAARGERIGYYSDYNGLEHLAKAYRTAFVYDGQYSERKQKNFGMTASNPGEQFVVFSQNHDQIGNRMLGERAGTLAGFEMQKLMTAAVLLSPYLPFFFMGEEWHETNPFLYFVSHSDPVLIEGVREGRKKEFAAFFGASETPDPNDIRSFEDSKLQWNLVGIEPYSTMHRFYKDLIAFRKLNPAIRSTDRLQTKVELLAEAQTIVLRRRDQEDEFTCYLNFSDIIQTIPEFSDMHDREIVFDSADNKYRTKESQLQKISGYDENKMLIISPRSALILKNIDKN